MELRQLRDGSITGTMYDANDAEPGRVTGRIKENFVEFTRAWGETNQQQFSLALSSDGRKLVGMFAGRRDASVGTDFEARRK